jgi:hyperosmotically inducible protein
MFALYFDTQLQLHAGWLRPMEWIRRRKDMTGTQKLAAAVLMMLPALAYGASSPSIPGGADAGAVGLEQRVLHELRTLPYYNVFDDLNFSVAGDRVTLTGQVTNPVLKTDAENAVKRLAGVGGVDDQIEVLPLSDFDRNIRMRTYFAIYGYGPLQRYGLGAWPSIHILVKNGNVRLTGVVDSNADRQVAYIRANGVPGVFSVTNELRVEKS